MKSRERRFENLDILGQPQNLVFSRVISDTCNPNSDRERID